MPLGHLRRITFEILCGNPRRTGALSLRLAIVAGFRATMSSAQGPAKRPSRRAQPDLLARRVVHGHAQIVRRVVGRFDAHDELARTIEPARTQAAEALQLERQLSDLVNEAYGLTPDEVALLWETARPRMPFVMGDT